MYKFIFLFVTCVVFQVNAQESWFQNLPYMPKPEMIPYFQTIFQRFQDLDLPDYKDPKNKTEPFKFKFVNAKFYGVFIDVPIENSDSHYIGMKGSLTFENKDYFEGTLIFDGDKCYHDGIYHFKSGETMRFFNTEKPFNTFEYTFSNGDKVISDDKETEGLERQKIKYIFKNGVQYKLLKFYRYDEYSAENFEFTNPEGIYIRGEAIYENLPYKKWTILDHGDLYFQWYETKNHFEGIFKKEGIYYISTQNEQFRAEKIGPFLYAFKKQNDSKSYFYFDNGVDHYVGNVSESQLITSTEGSLVFKLGNGTPIQLKGTMRNGYPTGDWVGELPAYSIFADSNLLPIQVKFFETGIEQITIKVDANRTYLLQNPYDEIMFLTGKVYYPNGIYEGTVDRNCNAKGEGFFTRTDKIRIEGKMWENNREPKATITKDGKDIRDHSYMYTAYSITSNAFENYDTSFSFTPTVTETVTEQTSKQYFKCTTCDGSGNSFIVCPGCKGKGYNSSANLVYSSGGNNYCVYCKGSGRYPIGSCGDCHGSGKISH